MSIGVPGSKRNEFHLPHAADGTPLIYFNGNSLGPQPKRARSFVEQALTAWAERAVEGHFEGDPPWYEYQEGLRDSVARLVGALSGEVVTMNTLTVNLHLMMATFFRPTAPRSKILMESPAFPSDLYAVKSQLRHHGFEPSEALITWPPPDGEHLLRLDDLEAMLKTHGHEIALVMINAVNFLTGQLLDVRAITQMARAHECVVGVDLAHAIGNVELELHDWDVDFAVWCNYKYVCGGPGAVAGCFVHERHGARADLPRLAGWWGNDPKVRFRMQLEPEFAPKSGAAGWQISNPPILSMAPLRASLQLFDEVGMPELRAQSRQLTDHLDALLRAVPNHPYDVITPSDPKQRGCQISLAMHDRPQETLRLLRERGVVCDFREPNVIRVAPAPFHNTNEEVERFVAVVQDWCG